MMNYSLLITWKGDGRLAGFYDEMGNCEFPKE